MIDESTTQEGVQTTTEYRDLSIDEATQVLLEKRKRRDAHRPSHSAEEEATEDTTETDGDTSETDEDQTTEDADLQTEEDPEKSEKTLIATDDHSVSIKVDGEEHQVSVKELKRLWGQEKALTHKSQELATIRKAAEEQQSKAVAALQHMVEKAKARWEPYAKVDFLVASKTLDADQLKLLREDAQEAFNEYRFLTEELDGTMSKAQQAAQEKLVSSAQECVKSLKDHTSPYYIQEWSNDLYNDLRSFAVTNGVDQDAIDTETSPAAFKILHMAMQFAKSKEVATRKIAQAPKKTVKSKQAPGEQGSEGVQRAQRKLQQSGSVDDAAAVLLARAKAKR